MTVNFYPDQHLVPKLRRINVDAASSRRTNANTTSFLRHVPAGYIHKRTYLFINSFS